MHWIIGATVVRITTPIELHDPSFKPIQKGEHRIILGVRDANMKAPAKRVPDEIQLETRTFDGVRVTLWYSSAEFRLEDQ